MLILHILNISDTWPIHEDMHTRSDLKDESELLWSVRQTEMTLNCYQEEEEEEEERPKYGDFPRTTAWDHHKKENRNC